MTKVTKWMIDVNIVELDDAIEIFPKYIEDYNKLFYLK